ncbi:hypothetical protein Q1695_016231 [Nippostrongylus brasiliensis]|nr:hypothetical protein Q1695_016231 [Nippostrongylus brasiliensis]
MPTTSPSNAKSGGKVTPRTKEPCSVCGQLFDLGDLYKHLRRVHFWTEQQLAEEKTRIRMKKIGKGFPCDICHKTYKSRGCVRHHRMQEHGLTSRAEFIFCPECSQGFGSHLELARHCDQVHYQEGSSQEFTTISGQFDSFASFETWKNSLGKTHTTNFVKRKTERMTADGRRHFYICKHKRLKSSQSEQSTDEIENNNEKNKQYRCPAFLKVLEMSDGSVTYEGCLGHLGHKVSAADLRLPKESEQEILNLLRKGMTAAEIAEKIRQERWNRSRGPDEQPRICYTGIREIERIADRYESEVAFEKLQQTFFYVNQLMRDCVKKNLHELISDFNLAVITKANEVARLSEKPKMPPPRKRSPVETKQATTERRTKRKQEKPTQIKNASEDDILFPVGDPLEMDCSELDACSLCGRRSPPAIDGDVTTWLSCSNVAFCKALAHESCSEGVGSLCHSCEEGSFREQPVILAQEQFTCPDLLLPKVECS